MTSAAPPSTANRLRGEIALELGDGPALTLRPSFGRLVAAEEELGSLVALVERGAARDVRLAAVVGLLWHCLAQPLERPDFEARCLEAGLARLLPAYRALLAQAFGGVEG